MSRRTRSSLPVVAAAALLCPLAATCGGDVPDSARAPGAVERQREGAGPGIVAEPPPGGIVPSAPNFGWTAGTFSVTDSGAAQYTLPLWVPEGRGTVEPKLALVYNSRNQNGLLGVGWSLEGMATITWCPRTYAQDGHTERLHYDGSDGLCLGDNRLMPVSLPQMPEREYRTHREMFARIVAYGMEDAVPDYFRVWSRDGKISTFGQTDDSRLRAYLLQASANLDEPSLMRAPGDRVTVAWALNRIEDRNGNAATVEYTREEGNDASLWWVDLRPQAIRYAPNRRVEFGYQPRTDRIDQFRWGIHVRNTVRMSSVAVFGGPEGGAEELLREYRLAYHNDRSITERSLVTRITECDGADACKLPLDLDWSPGSLTFQEFDAGSIAVNSRRLTVVDANGDGRADLVNQNGGFIRHGNATGTGFGVPVAAGIVAPQGDPRSVDVNADLRTDLLALVFDGEQGPGRRWRLYQPAGDIYAAAPGELGEWVPDDDDDPVYMADLDGNGLPDYISTAFFGPWSYRLNTGAAGADRFATRVLTDIPRIRPFGNFGVDTDGDGRTELISPRLSSPGWEAWGLNVGGGDETGTINLWGGPIHTHFGDLNGDGLDDAVLPYGTGPADPSLRVQLNSGKGFGSRFTTASPAGYVAPPYPVSAGVDHGVRIVDFDNDGSDDVLIFHDGVPTTPGDASQGLQLYVWRDGGFERADLSQEIGEWLGAGSGWANTEVLDIDGDTVFDVVNATEEGRLRLFKRTGGVPDRLTGIGNSAIGPRVEIDYTALGDRAVHTPGACAYPQACPVAGGHVVLQHRTVHFVGSAGTPTWDRYDHRYQAARTDLLGRGWLGFAGHTVIRLATGATTVTAFDNVTREPTTRAYAFAQLPASVTHTVVDLPGSPEAREHQRLVIRDLEFRQVSGGGYTVELQAVHATDRERPVNTSAWQTLRANSTVIDHDLFGNPELSTSTTTGGRQLTVDTDYLNDEDDWLIGLPTNRVTTGCTAAGECTTRESTFDHDDLGNPTVTIIQPNDPDLRLTTETTYGPFGVVESVTRTDGAGTARADTFAYDNADKLHPTSTFNALGHETVIETHSGLGVPVRVTDPNGVPTTMRYDRFGRPRETHHADGSFQRIDHVSFGFQFTTITSSQEPVRTLVEDQLGRLRERRVVTFDGLTATTHTTYDALGRVHQVSRPALAGETILYTTSAYDNLDRVTSITAPDGAVEERAYVGRETHTRDALDVPSYTVENADGEVESSFEDDPESSSWLQTRFEYGPFGEITRMVAPDGTAQVMEYDARGRRTLLDDPSRGTMVSDHDAFDGLVSETDGADRTTTYLYDELGRIKRITSPDGEAIHKWDTANDGIGKPVNATSPDGVGINYRYNTEGNPTTTQWNIDGTQYQIARDYDELGRLASVTYPAIPGLQPTDRLKVLYVYNDHGYLEQVVDAAPAGPVYWTAEERNAAGQLTRERYANGVVTTYDYEPPTGLLSAISVAGPGDLGLLAVLSYSFDLNRNVTIRADEFNGRTDVYGYDELNRLTSWSGTSATTALTAAYDYDVVGRLESEDVEGVPNQDATYTYGENGAPRHALTRRNTVSYGYDGAGQQVSGPNRTVEYNRSGLPSALTWGIDQGGTVRTEFAYDANGARVRKSDVHQTVVYAGGLFERRTPAGSGNSEIHNLHNILVDGRPVAQVNRTQASTGGPITITRVVYLNADRQGSTVLVTRADGQPYSGDNFLAELIYDPFGRRIDSEYEPLGTNRRGGPRQGYTGHEHEDEYGLINMIGRIYDPTARRFLTPDPIVQDRLLSQSHNRYAYVWNNPATRTDPTGFEGEGGTDDDDSTPTQPGEVIVVVGTVEIHGDGDAFWQSEGRYWAWYATSRSPVQVVNQWTWIAAKNISDKFRRRNAATERFYQDMNTLDTTMGVAAAAACLAVGGCRALMGDEATEYLVDTAFGEGTYDAVMEQLPELPPGKPGGPGKPSGGGPGGCSGPGCICFVPGTLVRMADGSTRPIEEIEPGDLVLADDPQDGSPPSAHEVVERHETFTGRVVHIAVDDGDGIVDGEIESTGGHPFWTLARGWRDADSLLVGDELQSADGGVVVVAGLWVESRETPTFNLSIADLQTYFVVVGEVDALVHNQAPFLPDDPYSPENTSRRESQRRRDMGLNADPDSKIPPQRPGRDMGGHEARGQAPHETGERNVNPNEEHSRVPKGQGGRGPRGRRGCP